MNQKNKPMIKSILKYCVFLVLFFACIPNIRAQVNTIQKDTVLTKRQMDRLQMIKRGFKNSVGTIFKDFSDNNIMLQAGMNFSKQNILANDYTSPFIYAIEQKNVYKPGYMAGFRIDGKYKNKYPYAFFISLNKYVMGTNYKDVKSLDPYIGDYSSFKAADQFFTLNMTTLYKMLLPISDITKYKFYVVAGPSIDLRLSGQDLDNQVNNNYRSLFVRADIGLEFDNKSYYSIFLHYKQGLHSITKSPIQTNFNNLELGMFIKASDLF